MKKTFAICMIFVTICVLALMIAKPVQAVSCSSYLSTYSTALNNLRSTSINIGQNESKFIDNQITSVSYTANATELYQLYIKYMIQKVTSLRQYNSCIKATPTYSPRPTSSPLGH